MTEAEQYPQHIMMEFTQDKCDLLNIYKVGDVKVSINLRGRMGYPQGDTKYNTIQRGESKKCSWTILSCSTSKCRCSV
jgi:hypothetical protein